MEDMTAEWAGRPSREQRLRCAMIAEAALAQSAAAAAARSPATGHELRALADDATASARVLCRGDEKLSPRAEDLAPVGHAIGLHEVAQAAFRSAHALAALAATEPARDRSQTFLALADRRAATARSLLVQAQSSEVERLDEDELNFLLTWIQPGLAGLMDGSVSTLAPIFAAAFATQDTWTTFQVGLAASVGAGISMGFTEAASDDGRLTGRGAAWKRGLASGLMTTLGGLGHALPYLIAEFWTATILAVVIVFVELWAITWIQHRFMRTPIRRAVSQVALGGALVLGAGMLIGSG